LEVLGGLGFVGEGLGLADPVVLLADRPERPQAKRDIILEDKWPRNADKLTVTNVAARRVAS